MHQSLIVKCLSVTFAKTEFEAFVLTTEDFIFGFFFYQPLVTEITRSQDMENRITNSNARSCNNPSFTHWCIVTYLIQGRQSRCAALSYPCISHAHAWLYSAPVLRSPGRQRSSVTNSLTFFFFLAIVSIYRIGRMVIIIVKLWKRVDRREFFSISVLEGIIRTLQLSLHGL